LWADRLLVSLAPNRVALARVRGRWRPKLISKQVMESDQPLDALRSAVAALGKKRLQATVVLSNRFVRYAVVPCDAAVSGPEEELALARFHFSRIHGERAKGWDLRLSDGPSGAARLASAVDAGLVAAIRGCFPSGSGAKLVSVQPYLMAAYNRWRDAIAREDAWLVLPETDGACLAYATRAGWLAARLLRYEDAGGTSLAESMEREQLRLAAAPRAALVHGAPPPALSGWKLFRLMLPPLGGYSPLEDGAYAMALCAR
jgi:hypothetical protein